MRKQCLRWSLKPEIKGSRNLSKVRTLKKYQLLLDLKELKTDHPREPSKPILPFDKNRKLNGRKEKIKELKVRTSNQKTHNSISKIVDHIEKKKASPQSPENCPHRKKYKLLNQRKNLKSRHLQGLEVWRWNLLIKKVKKRSKVKNKDQKQSLERKRKKFLQNQRSQREIEKGGWTMLMIWLIVQMKRMTKNTRKTKRLTLKWGITSSKLTEWGPTMPFKP